jgi:hypothetical protein
MKKKMAEEASENFGKEIKPEDIVCDGVHQQANILDIVLYVELENVLCQKKYSVALFVKNISIAIL